MAQPALYRSDNEFTIGAGESGYEAAVTVTNGTKDPVAASLVQINATVNSAPDDQIFDGAVFNTQDVALGKKLIILFRLKVKKGTAGPLQIAVSGALNEPVFFTGRL